MKVESYLPFRAWS